MVRLAHLHSYRKMAVLAGVHFFLITYTLSCVPLSRSLFRVRGWSASHKRHLFLPFSPHPLPHHFLFRLRFSYRATVSLSLRTSFNHAYMNPIRTTNEKRIKKPRQQRRLKPKIYRRELTHSDKTGTSDFVERLTILAVNRKSIVKRDAFRFSVWGIRDLGMSPIIPLLFPWTVPSTFTHAMKSSESKKRELKTLEIGRHACK